MSKDRRRLASAHVVAANAVPPRKDRIQRTFARLSLRILRTGDFWLVVQSLGCAVSSTVAPFGCVRPVAAFSNHRNCFEKSAGGGDRTRTILSDHRILSPVRLPVPPPRRMRWKYRMPHDLSSQSSRSSSSLTGHDARAIIPTWKHSAPSCSCCRYLSC